MRDQACSLWRSSCLCRILAGHSPTKAILFAFIEIGHAQDFWHFPLITKADWRPRPTLASHFEEILRTGCIFARGDPDLSFL